MAMQYKKVLLGAPKGVDVKKANPALIATELGKFLQTQGVQAQGIKLPGLPKAQKMVKTAVAALDKGMKSKTAQEMGGSPELKVVGGIDVKGNISISVSGLLPPKKSGGKPENYDKTEVVRKDFMALLKELKSDKNVVVNLTKDWTQVDKAINAIVAKHKGDMSKINKDKSYIALLKRYDGDRVINRAAEKQAAKYGVEAKRKDEGDFGGITTGTVILAAHGSRVNASGTTLGTALGKMSPKQIVSYLTENKDKKKNLSKDFKGTLLLSGCFTAAGGIAPPDSNYDYDTFAGKVWNLLKAKGINCKVSGLPGQARTREDGGKKSVMPTEQAEYDRLKKEVADLDAALKKLGPKLEAGDPKVKAAANKKAKALMAQLKKSKAQKEMKVMDDLINSYGLDPVR